MFNYLGALKTHTRMSVGCDATTHELCGTNIQRGIPGATVQYQRVFLEHTEELLSCILVPSYGRTTEMQMPP